MTYREIITKGNEGTLTVTGMTEHQCSNRKCSGELLTIYAIDSNGNKYQAQQPCVCGKNVWVDREHAYTTCPQ